MAPPNNPGSQFAVNESGAVRLVGELDREDTDTHNVLLLAVDDGAPPRTATATLTVSTSVVCHPSCVLQLLVSRFEVSKVTERYRSESVYK